MTLTLQQRFANLRMFLSRAQTNFMESDAAKDTALFVDELERVTSQAPAPEPAQDGAQRGPKRKRTPEPDRKK
jgi:hypothetical protein